MTYRVGFLVVPTPPLRLGGFRNLPWYHGYLFAFIPRPIFVPLPVLPPPATCWHLGFVVVARPLRCLCRGPRPPGTVFVLIPLLYRLGPVLCCGASYPAFRARPPLCWCLGGALSARLCLGSWLRRRLGWGGVWYRDGLTRCCFCRCLDFLGCWFGPISTYGFFSFFRLLWVWLSGRGLRPTGLFVWFFAAALRGPCSWS